MTAKLKIMKAESKVAKAQGELEQAKQELREEFQARLLTLCKEYGFQLEATDGQCPRIRIVALEHESLVERNRRVLSEAREKFQNSRAILRRIRGGQ